MSTQCFTWSEADFTWIGNEYTWNEVCITLQVFDGGGKSDYYDNYKKLPEKDKEVFIKLILKIKDKTITQQKKKKPKKYKVTAKDVRLVVNTVLKEIKINTNN